jgi:Zn-dependent protease with chaperone function
VENRQPEVTHHQRRLLKREDILLLLSAVALGLGGAAIFSAYRAATASSEGGGSRIEDFVLNMAWPGVLIFLAVGAAVWFGWKAELD